MTNENCLEGIRCPLCGNDARFHIVCTTYAVVKDEGAEAYGDMEWDDESRATCAECHRTGPLGEFHNRPELPPDPDGMNDERAAWAGQSIAAFRNATGTDEEDALGDLLADLMHWADRGNFVFELALDRARGHYAAETSACQAAESVACLPTISEGGSMTTSAPQDTECLPGSPASGECPRVRFSLEGVDGNALSLIGAWRNAARRQGWAEADIEAVSHTALSGTYEHVLRTLLAHSESPDETDDA